MVHIKDPTATRKRGRVPIAQRSKGAWDVDDPRCPYAAVRRHWERVAAATPRERWRSTPLFQKADGSAVDTNDILTDARAVAGAAGEDSLEFGGMSLRIGGASDLYDELGPSGERVIAERGQWCSLIGTIYQRMSITAQFDASIAMANSDGVDGEAFYHGYVQPTNLLPRRGPGPQWTR